MAQDSMAQAQANQAGVFNTRRQVLAFKEGDKVLLNPHLLEWVKSKGTGVKLRQYWMGPFTVEQRILQNAYQLKLLKVFPSSNVINLEHLRPYILSPEHFGKRSTLPDSCKFLQVGEEATSKL
jgi:hypothetical protein